MLSLIYTKLENGSHYRASELIPCIFCVYVKRLKLKKKKPKKEEEEGGDGTTTTTDLSIYLKT